MIATAQQFFATITMPGVGRKVATPKVTTCLIEGHPPIGRETGYLNGALRSSTRLQPDVTIWAQVRRLKKFGGDWVQLTVAGPLRPFSPADLNDGFQGDCVEKVVFWSDAQELA